MTKLDKLFDGAMNEAKAMSFAEANEKAASINSEVNSANVVLQSFPRSSNGLPSEEVRLSPEYRAAKTAFDRAFIKLRNFNAIYTKRFAKELRDERNKRRTSSVG